MKIFIGIFLMLLVSPVRSSQPEVLTLKDTISMALEQNFQIQAAKNSADIARNNVHVGNAGLLPSLSLTGGFTVQDGNENTISPGTSATTQTGIQAAYTLFDGLGNIYRYRELQSEGRFGELQSRDTIELTLIQISGAYYAVASAYEGYLIARDLLAISQDRVKRAEKRSAYGQARSIDVLSARVDFTSDQVTLSQAKFAWDETKRHLNLLLNRDINTDFLVETDVTLSRGTAIHKLKERAFAHNARYLSHQEKLIQSRLSLQQVVSSQMPRLDLNSSYTYASTQGGWRLGLDQAGQTFRFGASLSFSLFNGFKTAILKANSRILLKTEELALEQSRLELEKSIISAFESYQNSLEILELEKQYLEAAEINFKRMVELNRLGQVTSTQFREAQLNLIRARTDVASAKYNAKMKDLELSRISGQLLQLPPVPEN